MVNMQSCSREVENLILFDINKIHNTLKVGDLKMMIETEIVFINLVNCV